MAETATATEAMDQVDCHHVSFYVVMTCDTATEAGVVDRTFDDFDEASAELQRLRDAGHTNAALKHVSIPAWSLGQAESPTPRAIDVWHSVV